MKFVEFIKEKSELIKVVIAAIATAAATIIFKVNDTDNVVRLITYILIYVFIGFDAIVGTFKGFRKSFFNENFLMVLATVVAFVLGEYLEAVAVMLLFAVGELFEDFAEERSEKAIVALTELMPEKATLLTSEGEVSVNVSDVKVGDRLIVKTGDRIVCDGVVVDGAGLVDNSMLTGESLPISALNGSFVNSGAVVSNGSFVVESTATAEFSSASKILKLVKEETEKKSAKEKFITRFAAIYTPIVIVLAVLVAFLPPIFGLDLKTWVQRALNLLVISCPCALVISVPLAYFAAVGNAFSNGMIVKGGVALEKANGIKTVVFDKTGTLTNGKFEVIAVYPQENAEKVLKTAAMLERYSNHPIAAAIVSEYDGDIGAEISVNEIAGMGIVSETDEKLAAGNYKLMQKSGVDCKMIKTSDTVVYVSKGDTFLGYVVIGDSIKSGVNEAIAGLLDSGINVSMLTGDNLSTAERVAKEVGITDYRAELMPDEKRVIVSEYKNGGKVAFVGDGINDAPSLAASDLAIAMGSGTDVASLCSDVILTNNNVAAIPKLIKLSKKTARIVKENIFCSIAVKAAVLVLSVVLSVPMWLAIFADVGVMALACLNSVRLTKRRKTV